MSKKDYELLATVLANFHFSDPVEREMLAHRLADAIKAENPNFKKDIFLKWSLDDE